MIKAINVLALDKDFQIVSMLAYTNLQWTRKYYESGTFSIEIPVNQYRDDMKYIYTKDRREMGLITQRNYIVKGQKLTYSLSGYFLENQLNRRVVYPKATSTNITNQPSWVNMTGKAETVAYEYFNAFKDVQFTYGGNSYESLLGIDAGTDLKRGHDSDHQRDGTALGTKIYTILKPSEMSYRVNYDFLTSKKVFEVWKGVDRTENNTENNNTIVFSTRFGNLKNPNVLIDETKYRNGYVVTVGSSSSSSENEVIVRAGLERATDDSVSDDSYITVSGSSSRNDYPTEAEYIESLHGQGHEKLLTQIKKLNIDFDAQVGSYEYLKDFDLGDKCSIEMPEINLSADAVLIGCYEVSKSGNTTLTLEFGTPILKGATNG